MNKEAGKRAAARAAMDYVSPEQTIGIGTGSTAKYFIEALGEKIQSGWSLRAIPTSMETDTLARAVGIEIITPDETTIIDLAVDGTDEADPRGNLIKGGGAALLREKIVAKAAKKFVVIADKSKRVSTLGAFPLPVEIEPFGWALTITALRQTLQDQGFSSPNVNLRQDKGGAAKSDGGHLIADCALGKIDDPAALDDALKRIPGVIETGLFCTMADVMIFGDEDGVTIDTP